LTTKKLVELVLKAMAEYDAESLARLFTEDVLWWPPPSAESRGIARPIAGQDAVVGFLTGSLGLFRKGTISYDVHHVIADDQFVAVGCGRSSLTAQGNPYHNEYCLVFRHVDGRVAEGWEHVDTKYAATQLDPSG
jgi:ketosteroid isomerase-like protein